MRINLVLQPIGWPIERRGLNGENPVDPLKTACYFIHVNRKLNLNLLLNALRLSRAAVGF